MLKDKAKAARIILPHPPGGKCTENLERNQDLWDLHLANPDYSMARLGRSFGLRRQVVERIIKRWARDKKAGILFKGNKP